MAKRDEKKDLRNFGLFLAALFAALGGISFYRGGGAWPCLWAVSAYGLVTGLFAKPALRPIFKAAMWVGQRINWFVTRLILTVFFFVVLTPVGIIVRILGKDLVNRRFDPNAQTYWRPPKRDKYDPEQSERLF